jgi:hypothetical protein
MGAEPLPLLAKGRRDSRRQRLIPTAVAEDERENVAELAMEQVAAGEFDGWAGPLVDAGAATGEERTEVCGPDESLPQGPGS